MIKHNTINYTNWRRPGHPTLCEHVAWKAKAKETNPAIRIQHQKAARTNTLVRSYSCLKAINPDSCPNINRNPGEKI